MIDIDYIIVGAGSAGCLLANRLSQDPNVRVLLLEAGGRDKSPWIHIPVGYFRTLHNPNIDWCYRAEPDPELHDRALDWPRGKVLGGSSSINGLLYVRGQAEDYDMWAQLGNTGWSYDEVLPLFKKFENYELGADEIHGGDGELRVSKIRTKSKISEAFIAAATEMGVPYTEDYNARVQEGVSYFDQTAHRGLRCSSAKAFLTPIKHRANLEIITHAHTQGLIFDDDHPTRARGVQYLHDGEIKEARLHTGGEVILSAGAIGSPQILELSGIGQGDVLKNAGVAVRHHLPEVGENLQDHLQIRLVFETNVPTMNDMINSLWGKLNIGLQYGLMRKGPMSLGASQVTIFARTQEHLATPDIQFHFQPLSADKPGLVMHPFSGFTSSVCQLRPESMGHIHIHSANAEEYPRIVPKYLSAEEDKRCAIRAVKFARKMTEMPSLAPFIVREHTVCGAMETDEDFLNVAREYAQTIYHPTSTCRMGADEGAVVDPRLRVRGISGLRIADASIMPRIVSGNTNAPTMMIAEKAALMMMEDRKQYNRHEAENNSRANFR